MVNSYNLDQKRTDHIFHKNLLLLDKTHDLCTCLLNFYSYQDDVRNNKPEILHSFQLSNDFSLKHTVLK